VTKKWTDDDDRWLRANMDRMDPQSLSHAIGHPLEEVALRVRKLRGEAESHARHKVPATLKEAQKELSAARRDYERAIEQFHRRQLEEAGKLFEQFLEKHPDEKEFGDRARRYLAACRAGRMNGFTDGEDPFYAAVFEKNRGNLDKALELLKRSRGAGDGRTHYLAACCHALAGDSEQALSNLRKAVAADSQNRIQARLETDLSSLRGSPEFSEIVAGA